MDKVTSKVNAIFAKAETSFKEKFCREGHYIADGGDITSVTCSMDAREYIAFIKELKEEVIKAIT